VDIKANRGGNIKWLQRFSDNATVVNTFQTSRLALLAGAALDIISSQWGEIIMESSFPSRRGELRFCGQTDIGGSEQNG